MTKPRDYEIDAGIRLTYDVLTDRGHDPERVRKALDTDGGDLWIHVYGPAVDNAAELIGLAPFPGQEDDA